MCVRQPKGTSVTLAAALAAGTSGALDWACSSVTGVSATKAGMTGAKAGTLEASTRLLPLKSSGLWACKEKSAEALFLEKMNRVWNSTRWQFAARIAAWHALLSLMIAVSAALLIFKGWYAEPFGEMLGVNTLVAVLIAVDVVCAGRC